MAILKVTIPKITSDFDHGKQSCSCCDRPATLDELWEMIEEKTPARGTAKVGRFCKHCWQKFASEQDVNPNFKYGTQTKDGLGYVQRLYPDVFDAELHAALIDNASGRKAQWLFMDGGYYRSPEFQSGRAHGHFKTIAEHCPKGKLTVTVFKDGVEVDYAEFIWDNAKAKKSKKKQEDVYLSCCEMVNELANRNRRIQIPCDARSKKEKAEAAKARK